MKKALLAFTAIAIVSMLALASLWQSSFFIQVHDQVQPERVYEMAQAILSGQYPPRFVPNLGYGLGYPLFNFYAPFPYYIGVVGYFLGFGLINGTKLMVTVGFLMAGVSMFLTARTLWGTKGALLSALLYLLAPYHAVQTYVRGSIGELYAYAFLPLIVLGLLEIYKPVWNRNKVFIGAIGLILLTLSHTVSLYMVLCILGIYVIVSSLAVYISKKNLKLHLARHAMFIGVPLLVSAYFWLPAFSEITTTRLSISSGNDVRYSDHFIALPQLWSSPWGFGGSAPGVEYDGMSFMIGKLTILLSIITILTAFKYKITANLHYQRIIVISLIVIALISIILMTPVSSLIWQFIPYFQLIQFPWRFLIFTNLALALLAGGAVYWLQKVPSTYRQLVFALGLVFITTYALYSLAPTTFLKPKYFFANGYYQKDNNQLTARQHLRFEASTISDEFLPVGAVPPQDPSQISQDQISCSQSCSIKDSFFSADSYYVQIAVPEPTTMYIDKSYFPNFEVKVDNVKKDLNLSVTNRIGVDLEEGEHTVKFTLKNTPIRQAANAISLVAMAVVLGYYALMLQKGNIPN